MHLLPYDAPPLPGGLGVRPFATHPEIGKLRPSGSGSLRVRAILPELPVKINAETHYPGDERRDNREQEELWNLTPL